jgi:hypothetical protein
MTIRQVVVGDDGSRQSFAIPGELRYVKAETHAHWHLLSFERYELRRGAEGRSVGRDRKTGFCLEDRYELTRLKLPHKPARPVWTGECGRGRPGLLAVRQGISPGYGDDYVPTLEGQYIDVTGLPAGRYLLVHRVNADRRLRESEYGNNAASVLLELRRTRRGPVVEVFASCPETATCS